MAAPTTPELISNVWSNLSDRGVGGTVTEVLGDSHLLYLELETERGARRASVVHRPDGEIPEVVGHTGATLARRAGETDADPMERALGMAVLNALSEPFLEWRTGDPMRSLEESVDTVAMVGMFGPVLRDLLDVKVRVIERHPGDVSLPDGLSAKAEVSIHGPEDAETVVPDADVLFVTGSTLIYGGIDRYLMASPPGQVVVLVGATASFLPDPAFEAGVSVLAGAEITDRQRVRDRIGPDGCEDELHGKGLRKVYTAPENADLTPLSLG